jgi:hypothetical protein
MNYGMLESFVSYGSLTRRNPASYMPVMQLTSAIILIRRRNIAAIGWLPFSALCGRIQARMVL